MNKKKRIGFFISDKSYVRNFIDTGILNNLCKKFDIYVFLNESFVFDKEKIKNATLIETYKPPKNDGLHQYANLVSLWNKNYKALSFRRRVIENFDIDQNIFITLNLKKIISKIFKRLIFYSVIFFSLKNIFPIFKKIFINNIEINKDLIDKIKKNQINLVIQPTSGHLSETLDLLNYCKNKQIITYLIIDNWDNLSSKVCYYHQPDYVSAWGDQSKIHGVKFHNLAENRVSVVGSARFNEYFKLRENKIENIFKKKHI